MMLSIHKKFDEYETMGEVFRDFKNELLEITLVEKLCQIIEIPTQEIFVELGEEREIFPDNLAENKINIENWYKPI
jgi:hypothetical protein